MLAKGTKIRDGYATIDQNDGVNYREIANTMTILGFEMNHSSARNYVLRVLKKIAGTLAKNWGVSLSETQLSDLVRSPLFHEGISGALNMIENERRKAQIHKNMSTQTI